MFSCFVHYLFSCLNKIINYLCGWILKSLSNVKCFCFTHPRTNIEMMSVMFSVYRRQITEGSLLKFASWTNLKHIHPAHDLLRSCSDTWVLSLVTRGLWLAETLQFVIKLAFWMFISTGFPQDIFLQSYYFSVSFHSWFLQVQLRCDKGHDKKHPST